MKKLFVVVCCVACSFLLSGCAAVVQGGAALAAGSAKDHPANKNFVVDMGKNDAFNASMRALTAKGRKITSSDREAGIVQGEFDDYAVTIKIAGKGSGSAVVDITVAYNQPFIYGSSKVEEVLAVVKGDIEGTASKKIGAGEQTQNVADSSAASAAVTVTKAKSKTGQKKAVVVQ